MGSGQVRDGEPNKTHISQMDPEITGTTDRDRYNRTVIGTYDHEPLQPPWLESGLVIEQSDGTDIPSRSNI